MSREEQVGRWEKRAGPPWKGLTSTSTRRPTQETAPQREGILGDSREEIGVAEKDFSEARDAASVLGGNDLPEVSAVQQPSSQIRAEQRHFLSQGLVTHSRKSHKDVLQQNRTGNQERSSSGG